MTRILHISSGQILRFPPEAGRDSIARFDSRVTEEYEKTHLWIKYKYSMEEILTLITHGDLDGLLAFNKILPYEGTLCREEFEVLL